MVAQPREQAQHCGGAIWTGVTVNVMGRWRSRLKGPKSRGYFVRRAILFIVVGQVLIAAEGRHFDDMRLAFVVFLHVPVVMIYMFAYRVLNRW